MTHARKKEEYTDCRECRRVVIAKDDAMHALWVQAGRVVDRTLVWVAAHEAAAGRVVPARAQVIEAEVGVVALAAVEIGVGGGAGLGDQVAEGVVLVGVGDGSGGIGEHAHRAPAVLHPTDEDLSVGTPVRTGRSWPWARHGWSATG